MLALTIAFGLISAGNSLFGSFTARSSRALGDLAYGVYLLHGLLLYATLTFVLGRHEVAVFTDWQHWAWLKGDCGIFNAEQVILANPAR